MIARTYPGTDIPELTDNQIKDIFRHLDVQFNEAMIRAGGHASRNNFQSPGRPRFLIFIILLLYLLAIFTLYNGWAVEIAHTTIPNGRSFWTASKYIPGTPILWTSGIVAILSTILADATLAWNSIFVFCGFLAYGWLDMAVLDCLGAIMAHFSRGIVAYCLALGSDVPPPRVLFLENIVSLSVLFSLYTSLILATLLWCTTLIIYRILRVGGAAGRIHVYQSVIEILVESASLYSAVLVVLVVFEARNELTASYIEDLASAIRGIVPTILVGRVAAGHARPDNSWSDNTTASSIRFRNHSSSQNDSQMSAEPGGDTPSPHIRPDLEEGLGDGTELRVEGAPLTLSVHDCSARIIGTPNSVD
ncbi:hypothetical protein ARMSODRAFT_980714 [Armillaria solidipes]|uniref:Uncharacterized protein n=1 Tax=Armillaria solidipes TaxID=1076256 RepID=A0A2H3B0K3_9AGAR|nr:hypothetical protein ARMSODRAFT_980714 [Armillaria solidipes]